MNFNVLSYIFYYSKCLEYIYTYLINKTKVQEKKIIDASGKNIKKFLIFAKLTKNVEKNEMSKNIYLFTKAKKRKC